jgi:hypothetical protein
VQALLFILQVLHFTPPSHWKKVRTTLKIKIECAYGATFDFFNLHRSHARRVRRLRPSPPFPVAPDFVLDILNSKGAKASFSTTIVKKSACVPDIWRYCVCT